MKLFCKLFMPFILLLILTALPFSQLRAQENEPAHSLYNGSRALQFQIGSNFNLGAFTGTAFSYKRHLSPDLAHRIGLTFGNAYRWSGSPDPGNDQENFDMSLNIGLNYTWMHYVNPETDIKFYYGYGPGLNIGYDRSQQTDPNVTNTTETTTFGLVGLAYTGVEWFFHDSMSLHAEYRAAIQLNRQTEKNTAEFNGNENVTRTNSTILSLGGNGVRFGLSVYF